jgi:hypothetical protein
MTPEASNTLLLWAFIGLAVVGAYTVIACPFLIVFHFLNKMPVPLPEKKLDELLREINEGQQ